jgi:hypothetical protein
VIKANRKNGTVNAPITVKDYQATRQGSDVQILDESGNLIAKIIYRPQAPLACGAHVWIETQHTVVVE